MATVDPKRRVAQNQDLKHECVAVMHRRATRWLSWLVSSIMILAGEAHADDLALPKGPVLLTIAGKIENANRDGVAVFDEAMLMALPWHSIETSTPWTDGKNLFEGVRLSSILDRIGVGKAEILRVMALNEFEHFIPVSDVEKYGVLLAMRMDGKALSRRDKGPIWLVYPRDDFPELQDERQDSKWVWQLTRIEVQ